MTDKAEAMTWIPVDERLPETDLPRGVSEWCLVYGPLRNGRCSCTSSEDIRIARCCTGACWLEQNERDHMSYGTVTHWMPLPEEPEIPTEPDGDD